LVNNGVKPEKISVLPYFIDYESPQEVAEPDAKRMLYAGRIVDAKGLDVLLDVLTLVKEDFILDVAGTGPMEKICQDKVKNLGLTDKVAFHGWVERKGLAELYKKCSFLVLPSVWPEPFGICGIEAAFFGKPAVAFNVGGVSDWLIDGETGFLVEPYRKEEMAEKISYLLNNSEKVQELGREARKRAIEKYNPELHVKELLKILEK
jgi:glycosyltransferase involved in cell wall biosynthesis